MYTIRYTVLAILVIYRNSRDLFAKLRDGKTLLNTDDAYKIMYLDKDYPKI